MSDQTFPVLLGGRPDPGSTWVRRCVPWSFVAPHEAQAVRNHDQSLVRLASRGGLSPAEMLCVVKDQEWQWWAKPIPHAEVEAELARLLAAHESGNNQGGKA